MSATIVVGVQGTEPSRSALRWSVRRAGAISATVVLVHVLDDEWATLSARIQEDLHEDARRLVEREAEYASSLAPGVVVRTRLLHGSLMNELLAASGSADMVAVGTHKTGFVNGKVFGSRSLLLAAAARTPVAIIPGTSKREGRGVVVGVDGSVASDLAIHYAAIEADRAREHLTLLQAFTVSPSLERRDELRSGLVRHIEAHSATLLSDAARLAHSVAPAIEVRIRSVRRPAAQALVDASAGASLLIIGGSRSSGGEPVVVGSVGHDVLINLTGPTIVVPETVSIAGRGAHDVTPAGSALGS